MKWLKDLDPIPRWAILNAMRMRERAFRDYCSGYIGRESARRRIALMTERIAWIYDKTVRKQDE